MIWVGAGVVLLAFAACRRYDPRLVLLVAGVLMTMLAGKFVAAFDALAAAMANGELVPVVCTAIGFAWVMRHSGCQEHFAAFIRTRISRKSLHLLPLTVLATFTVNAITPSAATCAALVGVLLIPALIGTGIRPAVAGSAVLAGTWGGCFSTGNIHIGMIAKLAGVSGAAVIHALAVAAVGGILLVAALTMLLASRGQDGLPVDGETGDILPEQVEPLKVVIPLVPLLLIALGSDAVGLLSPVSGPEAMLIGAFLGYLVRRGQPEEVCRLFFTGTGEAFAAMIGLIAAAAVFIEGMKQIGLIGVLIQGMSDCLPLVKISATVGPFVYAVLSGSGDAATIAFNGMMMPVAKEMGAAALPAGIQALLAGALGRSMSPISGATLICAVLAGVNPLELAKHNAPAMLLAALLVALIL